MRPRRLSCPQGVPSGKGVRSDGNTEKNVMRTTGRYKHSNIAVARAPGWMSHTAQHLPHWTSKGRVSTGWVWPGRQRELWVRQVQGHKDTFLHDVDCHISLTLMQALVHPFIDEETKGQNLKPVEL